MLQFLNTDNWYDLKPMFRVIACMVEKLNTSERGKEEKLHYITCQTEKFHRGWQKLK